MLIAVVVVSFIVNMQILELTVGRIFWAQARDGQAPGASWLRKVSSTGTPTNATLVAGVLAFRRHHAVLFVAGVEVAAGRCEGRLAFADRVDVEGVLARRQSLDGKIDQHTVRRLRQVSFADFLALGILQWGACNLRGRRQRRGDEEDRRKGARSYWIDDRHSVAPFRCMVSLGGTDMYGVEWAAHERVQGLDLMSAITML